MGKRFTHPFITFILVLISIQIHAQQYLVSSNLIGNTPKIILNNLAPVAVDYDVSFYKITYNTVDVNGTPTIASGMVAIPVKSSLPSDCDTLPMLAYCHGTVLKDDDVPSENNFESLLGKMFSGMGYITVMPDYLGFGVNTGLHPYVHAESEATATIDAMRAAKEFIALETDLAFNNQIFLTGYSQGGHAAMATHKYIQDNGLYGEFNVVASAPCSGPYNMSGFQIEPLLNGASYGTPGYIIYLLMSYELAYGNIYNSISDVLKSPYDTLIPPYFEGAHDMNTVNALLPNYLDSILVDTFLLNFRNDTANRTHPLWVALADNDNHNWKPERPVRMYYCTADEQVYFQNSLEAELNMLANGAPNVKASAQGNLSHGLCVAPALTAAAAFMDSLRVMCSSVTGIQANKETGSLHIYPNPTKHTLFIDSQENIQDVQLFTLNGVELGFYQVSNNTIDLSALASGIYLIQMRTFEGKIIHRKLIRE